MYIPTKNDLEGLNFNHEYDDYHEELQAWHTQCATDININIKDNWEVEYYLDQNKDLQFYPESFDDLKTFIRILTPQ